MDFDLIYQTYFTIVIIFCAIAIFKQVQKQSLQYSQEYVVGQPGIKGHVDVQKYIDIHQDFDIGANKYGLPVFKNPERALSTFKELYSDAITLIQGIVLSANIDDLELQAYAKAQFLSTDDPDVISFVKFIDIYENYAYNDTMRKMVTEIEARTFSSSNELLRDDTLFELLSMMPVTVDSTLEGGSAKNNNTASATSSALSGYDADAAVSYASTWAYKTNNTDYGYYASYNNHPTPKNNNMWSGGTGNNKRTWQDCANYVSQCLAAGGAEQIESGWLLPHQKTENWYYSDSKPSHTWGGAPNFFNHWKDRVGVRSSTNDAKKGDPFSVDYGGDNIPEHTLIITSVSGTSTSNMKYACHTSDQFEEPGKSLRTIYDSCESVWIYKVG